jgi:hypothetical protein
VHTVVWEIVRRYIKKENISKYEEKSEKGLSALYDVFHSSTYGNNRYILPLNDTVLTISPTDVISGMHIIFKCMFIHMFIYVFIHIYICIYIYTTLTTTLSKCSNMED